MYVRSTACNARRLRKWLLCLAALCLTVSVHGTENALAECWQGISSDGASYRECPLGDYVADAVRAETNAEIALIPAEVLGGALVGDGGITEDELRQSLPDDCPVAVVQLTAPELKELLERGADRWTLTEQETLDPGTGSPEFLQVSGLRVRYDASAPPGERVLSLSVAGAPLTLTDEGRVYTVALPAGFADQNGDRTAGSLRALVRNQMVAQGTVEPPEGDRIQVIGAHQRDLISFVPPGLLAVVILLLVLNAVFPRKRPTK